MAANNRIAPKHRHQKWLKFLQKIEQAAPPNLDVSLILDNSATHPHPKALRACFNPDFGIRV